MNIVYQPVIMAEKGPYRSAALVGTV